MFSKEKNPKALFVACMIIGLTMIGAVIYMEFYQEDEEIVTIHTSDGREITLIGEEEIDKYLHCELQEMSTLECPTHTQLNRNSYFIE